ncbi:hypothetical protein EMPS_03536 [Entomortierella parvispora]|uniref:ArfGap-domain-containing protein n=1 Tax=Entomortierella parvispora TaxID=205924 RepID=A0A9P3LUI0_9FUNG|nr:hypothetical protein EMPS_03536 [Entomortierella parvispora]
MAMTALPTAIPMADPVQFAIARIAIQDADSCPVISQRPELQEFVVQTRSPTLQPEFVTDPEESALGQTNSGVKTEPASSSSSAVKSLPLLLLRVSAGEEMRFDFDLRGRLLDALWHRSQHDQDVLLNKKGGQGTKNRDQDQDEDLRDEDQDHKQEQNKNESMEKSPRLATRIGHNDDQAENAAMQSVTNACRSSADKAPEGNDEAQGLGWQHVAANHNVYFVETRSEQAMQVLLEQEALLQQQIQDRSISPIRIEMSSDSPQAALASASASESPLYTYTWIWNRQGRGRAEGNKAVFAFLGKDSLSGKSHILAQFSLWIEPNISSAVQRPARPPRPAHPPSTSLQPGKNPRHWRRSSTPEKNVGRMPTFWSKLPYFPNSNQSLPILPDATVKTPDTNMPLSSEEGPGTTVPIPLANGTEDGPLFRATVVECENHIRNMKGVMKQVQKATQTLLESRRAWVAAEQSFAKEMAGLKVAEPLLDLYLRPMTQNLGELSELFSQQTRDMFVQPLSAYWIEIKAAEVQRKQFEEESKEYYNYLSKYLGMKQESAQKKMDADLKYEQKRRHFELKRMEYWAFLTEMRAGSSKDEWLASQLANYLDKHCQYLISLGTVSTEMKSELKAATVLRTQRREHKALRHSRSLSQALSAVPKDNVSASPSILNNFGDKEGQGYRSPSLERRPPRSRVMTGPSEVPARYAPILNNSSSPSITGFRDLEHQDIEAGIAKGRRKEGFLFATSKPNSHNTTVLDKSNLNWHKYWCVLSEGQLHEYSHWKRGVTQPHNEPINLRIATVRPCRNQDRRFCFEVITPRFRRVYQATSVDDMNSWIHVISNAIHGLLNGTSSCRNLNLEYNMHSSRLDAPEGKGMLAGLGGMARASMEQVLYATSLPMSIQTRVQPGQAVGKKRGGSAADGLNELGQIMLPRAMQPPSPDESQRSLDLMGARLLQLMRETHVANTFCADCGAKNPDWCVINLGILVCIECSGIHRSLGTHISKVRSFNLDTTSYTRDLFDYIRAVGNEVSNNVWEARLLTEPPSPSEEKNALYFQKPVTNDSREHKVAFIRKKYVERAFIDREEERAESSQDRSAAATSALFRAVEDNDISAALKAYAAGADLNAAQRANKDADSGPFFEEQADSSVMDAPPPLPVRQPDDTFGLGSIPNVAESPIMTEGTWQTTVVVDDSNVSDAGSSRFSRSTTGSISDLKVERLAEPRPRDLTPLQGGTWELWSRPAAGRPISSVMVMQTSPLLIALRQGVPFSQDSAFEVYPMAEFLIQNGAASNTSVQVKVLDGLGLAAAGRAMAPPLPIRPSPRRKGDLEAPAQVIIEQDVPLQSSTSIVSRLSESTVHTTSMESSGRTPSTAPSFETTDGDDETTDASGKNRRSVGQVVELRGESGASAMEYLRGKRVARGEAVPMVIPPLSSSPGPMVQSEASASRSSTDLLGTGLSAPVESGVASTGGSYTASITSTLTNLLSLSPRLRPERASIILPSAPVSLDPFLTPPGSGSSANMSSSQPAVSGARQPAQPQQPDISSLFQKRRESDGGIGSVLFSARKGGEKDKEKIAAKAKARMSGDFSLLQPTSFFASFTSSSQSSQEQQQPHREQDQEQQGQNISRTTSPPLSLSLSQSSSLSGGVMSSQELTSYPAGSPSTAAATNTSLTPSRAQKVKASFTKSWRLSAAYLKNNKTLKEDRDQNITNVFSTTGSIPSSSTTLPTKYYGRVSTSSQQDFGHPIEFEGEEPTMEELLRQQDQQQFQQQVESRSRSRSPGPRGDGDIFQAARTSMSSLSLSFSAPTLTAVALDGNHNIAQ